MGWAFITHNHATCAFNFLFGSTAQQHLNPSCQVCDLLVLARNGVGQFLNTALQMGHSFFKLCDVVIHTDRLRRQGAPRKRELA
jgi:hypothetical protein